MLASIARRGSDRAAAGHAQLFKMANGEASGRQLAEKQSRRLGVGQLAPFRCALPREEGAAMALLSDEKYHFPNR